MKIAVIGDYDETDRAHQAVPPALGIAAESLQAEIDSSWIRSSELAAAELRDFDAFWVVPLSPYQDPPAVIDAIGFGREQDLPYLGTCADYQYAVLEYARNRLGLSAADSIEYNPERSAFKRQQHPLIREFVRAAV